MGKPLNKIKRTKTGYSISYDINTLLTKPVSDAGSSTVGNAIARATMKLLKENIPGFDPDKLNAYTVKLQDGGITVDAFKIDDVEMAIEKQ